MSVMGHVRREASERESDNNSVQVLAVDPSINGLETHRLDFEILHWMGRQPMQESGERTGVEELESSLGHSLWSKWLSIGSLGWNGTGQACGNSPVFA
jgi:hypothetical protein